MIQTGDGLLIRDPSINPPLVRKILQSIGNEKVSSLTLIRTPLSKTTRFLLNIVSLGQLESKMKELKIDDLFHLSMLINGKYTLEKNEVIRLYKSSSIPKGSNVLQIPITHEFTINEMLENTRKSMGSNYGSYNAKTNNCSIFLSNVLNSNQLLTNNAETFLQQNTIDLFNSFPKYTEKITNLATTTASAINRQLEGEGQVNYDTLSMYNNQYPKCKVVFTY